MAEATIDESTRLLRDRGRISKYSYIACWGLSAIDSLNQRTRLLGDEETALQLLINWLAKCFELSKALAGPLDMHDLRYSVSVLELEDFVLIDQVPPTNQKVNLWEIDELVVLEERIKDIFSAAPPVRHGVGEPDQVETVARFLSKMRHWADDELHQFYNPTASPPP